jgi:uncharacterized membrane protein YhhN
VNTLTWILLAVGAALAVTDWVAVHTGNRTLEYAAKPATMVPLIVAAHTIDAVDPTMRFWFVVALLFSLAGDVFLMLPNEDLFVAGLGSFLVGHVAYVAGLGVGGVSTGRLVVGAVLTLGALGAIGPTLVAGARDTDRRLAVPVLAYMAVISVMVTFAVGSGVAIAIVGALLFYLSDFCIGWSRFVSEFSFHRLAIIVTYHLAQAALVISLAVAR